MKKNLVRGSVLTVAALSMLIGGISTVPNPDVKNNVTKTQVIVSKAVQKNVSDVNTVEKGTAVTTTETTETTEVAVNTDSTEDNLPVSDNVDTKEAKVESNQVVANIDTYLNIRAEASEDSEVVGKFYNGNVGTLVEQGDEWSLVSSGNAYGYVKNDYILSGAVAESYIENNCDQMAKVNTDTLNIRAEESTDSNILALSGEGDKLEVVGEEDGWVKVAVDAETIGYVSSDYVCIDYAYETAITIEEEEAAIAEEEARRKAEEEAAAEAARQAEAEAAAKAQQSSSSSTSSSKTTTSNSTTSNSSQSSQASTPAPAPAPAPSNGNGSSIASFACQFVGNPYVYGGTSLTNGADCSGFVQSVFKNFGYSLPRTAASQADAGVQVSLSDLQPGDLLFYHGFGHVAIYIGNGQVVHASNAQTGIKISQYNYSNIDKAVRILN